MNSVESNRELAENKLILLYIIINLEAPASNLLITNVILENKIMNYIFLQQYLDELCDGKFIDKLYIKDKIYYKISPSGKQSLDFFLSLIPAGTKAKIDDALTGYKKQQKNQTIIIADFEAVNENEYITSLKIAEGNFTYIELKLTVGSRNDARKICDNWSANSEKLYRNILGALAGE